MRRWPHSGRTPTRKMRRRTRFRRLPPPGRFSRGRELQNMAADDHVASGNQPAGGVTGADVAPHRRVGAERRQRQSRTVAARAGGSGRAVTGTSWRLATSCDATFSSDHPRAITEAAGRASLLAQSGEYAATKRSARCSARRPARSRWRVAEARKAIRKRLRERGHGDAA